MGSPFLGDYQGVDKETGNMMFTLEANNFMDEVSFASFTTQCFTYGCRLCTMNNVPLDQGELEVTAITFHARISASIEKLLCITCAKNKMQAFSFQNFVPTTFY